MGEHSILPPSGADVWRYCTGRVTMGLQRPKPNEPTQDTLEGEAVHLIGSSLILIEIGLLPADGQTPVEGYVCPNGVTITDEMLDSAEIYAEYVTDKYYDMADRAGTLPVIGTEERTDIKAVHSECFGTPDVYIYSEKLNELAVIEYKNGHLQVIPFFNNQLICYDAGLARKLPIVRDCKITNAVVQPRAYRSGGPVNEWVVSYDDLLLEIGKLSVSAAKALGANAKLVTGPHCKFCDSRLNCDLFIQSTFDMFQLTGSPVPIDVSPRALGVMARYIEAEKARVKSMHDALTEQIKALIKRGETVPGWEVKPSMGREAWNIDPEAVVAVGEMLEMDLSKPAVITPNQARKLGMPEDLLKLYAGRNENGLSLVQTDPNRAARVFEKGEYR